jgi:hypothetical protein
MSINYTYYYNIIIENQIKIKNNEIKNATEEFKITNQELINIIEKLNLVRQY